MVEGRQCLSPLRPFSRDGKTASIWITGRHTFMARADYNADLSPTETERFIDFYLRHCAIPLFRSGH